MTEFEAAFDELLDSRAETSGGKRAKILIGSKSVDAFIETDQNSFVQMAGGQADAGSYIAMVRKSDFQDEPAQGTEVTKDGVTQSILTVTSVNDTWRIEIGDIAAEDARQ